MDNMQDQMNAILNNPEMMQQIMAMAQNLSQSPSQDENTISKNEQHTKLVLPEIDPSLLQRLTGLAGKVGIDTNQQTLLSALAPYVSNERILKLEKAMRAAKMANIASVFLSNSGLLSDQSR